MRLSASMDLDDLILYVMAKMSSPICFELILDMLNYSPKSDQYPFIRRSCRCLDSNLRQSSSAHGIASFLPKCSGYSPRGFTRAVSSDIEPDPGRQSINHHLEKFTVTGPMIIVRSNTFA